MKPTRHPWASHCQSHLHHRIVVKINMEGGQPYTPLEMLYSRAEDVQPCEKTDKGIVPRGVKREIQEARLSECTR